MKHNRRKDIKVAYGLSLGFILFSLFFSYTGHTAEAQTGITIKGNITNIPPVSSNIIHLYSYYGNELSEDASASVNEQGDFKLEIKDTLQQGLYKIGLDQTNAANIVISGESEMVIKADYMQLKADNVTVTNSRENEAYSVLLNEWKRLANKMAGLSIERSQVSVVDPFYVKKIK